MIITHAPVISIITEKKFLGCKQRKFFDFMIKISLSCSRTYLPGQLSTKRTSLVLTDNLLAMASGIFHP